MFIEQLRRAVEASPRVELPKVSALLWKAFAAGHVSEAEAEALTALIEARKAVNIIPSANKVTRLVGSRPKTPESLARRRRWVASGALPPALASRFTAAENAVLAVIAAEVMKHGRCTLVIGHIAALAGVSRTTVKNAMREARRHGLMRVEEKRVSAWRNAANVVTIVSAEWNAWLRMRRRGEGANQRPPRIPESNKGTLEMRSRAWAAEGQGGFTGGATRSA